jgi:hypothetical protein
MCSWLLLGGRATRNADYDRAKFYIRAYFTTLVVAYKVSIDTSLSGDAPCWMREVGTMTARKRYVSLLI